MDFGNVNYFAVGLAGAASFVFGAGWYGAFGKLWMRAASLTETDIRSEDGKARPAALPFVVAILSQFTMAYMLAVLISSISGDQITVMDSLQIAIFVWLGFVVTTMLVNYSFQSKPLMLSVVDGGHWLGALAVQASIIGWIGLPGV